MMRIRDLNRWQAFAGHLSFSLLLGMVVFALFRFLWYPGALFTLAGAGKLMLLVVGIDVILGPLLTLIVFNPGKKSLIWDLAVILVVQVSALGYGVWVMAQSRPVFLVGATDRFELVTANQIRAEDLASASKPEWQRLSWAGPVVVGARPPSDPDERMSMVLGAMEGGPDLTQLPRYYVPLPEVMEKLLKESKPLAYFESIAPREVADLRAWLQKRNFDESNVAILPLKARKGMGALMIDRPSATPLRTATFDGYGKVSKDAVESKQTGADGESPTLSHSGREGLPIGTAYASIPWHACRAGPRARDQGQLPVPRA